MNIQRYTWPVIIAASLHGALFLGSSHRTPIPETTLSVGDILPPKPPTEVIEITPPDPEAGAEAVPAVGGPAARELPELTPVLLDSKIITQPVVEQVRPETYAKSLKEVRGIGGIEIGNGHSVGSSIIPAVKLDRRPRATAQMSPDYPATMRLERVAGTVTVEFDVDREGRVVRVEAVRYTRREFVEPALRAVRNWHFEPGKRNGATVPFRMAVPIEFSIEDI